MVQLNEFIGQRKLMQIITSLLNSSETNLSQTELLKKTKISKTTAIKWLDFLEKSDLIQCQRIGTTNLYSIKKENPIIKEFKRLKSIAELQTFAQLAQKQSVEIYLYGSAARGEDTPESDYDILIIGTIKMPQIISDIAKLEKNLKKKISIKIFTHFEWSELKKKDPAFYERVEKDKLRLSWI